MSIALARQLLELKMRETMAECRVPALAAVLVRQEGATIISSQLGVRKLGATGSSNTIQPADRFNLGSMSKVITGHLIGRLIQDKVGNLAWTTKLGDVFPYIGVATGRLAVYRNVTIEQLLTHVSGMPGQPSRDDVNDYLSWTAADLTKAKLMQRRLAYVDAAVQDPPVCRKADGQVDPECGSGTTPCQPGDCVQYSGGGVICASIAELKTGTMYEDLVRTWIYGPLGMAGAGFGELSPGALDGPWLHAWKPDGFTVVPHTNSKRPSYSWYPRNPVGAACCSAAELGLFLKEQVRPDPQLFTPAARMDLQTTQVSPASGFVRGAWMSSDPGMATADISHNGATEGSYSNMVVSLSTRTAYGAMTNIHSTFGNAAVDKIIAVMRAIEGNWATLFSKRLAVWHECAHPMPAFVSAGPNAFLLFARRHTGAVVRQRGTPVFGNIAWDASVEFPSAVITSGLAAASSGDGRRVMVVGRGADNRMWRAWSTDAGITWQGWQPIGAGLFVSGAALTMSTSGMVLHAFGTGLDGKIYQARSSDGGAIWSDWVAIGKGIFTSAPGAAASADGRTVHVVGRGTDARIWRNHVVQGGPWQPNWQPIGAEVFTSSPSATVSSDGKRVHVVARGTDRAVWRNTSTNAGSAWLPQWSKVPSGAFTSAPALLGGVGDTHVRAVAIGDDFRPYVNHSGDDGAQWDGWKSAGNDLFL